MAGLTKPVIKKAKKHGVKAGQKSKVRPSQKKSVKNGRHQEKQVSKKTAKAIAAIPPGLDGKVVDDECNYLDEPVPSLESDLFDEVDVSMDDEIGEYTDSNASLDALDDPQ